MKCRLEPSLDNDFTTISNVFMRAKVNNDPFVHRYWNTSSFSILVSICTCLLSVFFSLSLLEPSRGPENVLSIEIGRTEYQITWDVLPREVANGFIKIYQVRLLLKESCSSVDASFNSTFNTTKTEMLLSSLSICSRYEVSVRAFTVAGPGPYSEPLVIQTLGESKKQNILMLNTIVF